MALDEIVDGLSEVSCDVLVIGGGTAGPMAALKAKLKNPKANVVLLEKANVKRSGAISMGMDGLNNAVIPGYATPEQYTKEITIANDGIVDQKTVYEIRAELLHDDRGARQLRHPLREERERRLRGQARCTTSAPTCCRCRTARPSRRRSIASSAAPAVADLQPLHGDAPADGRRRPHRRRDRRQHPHRRIPGRSAPRP